MATYMKLGTRPIADGMEPRPATAGTTAEANRVADALRRLSVA
jgi:hypothetical protein